MNNNNIKIVVFSNYRYLTVLKNWLLAMERINIRNILIISLDRKIHEYLTQKKIKSLLRPCELGLGKLWIHRIEVLLELMEQGYDVIHSDADAIWLKNPLNYLNGIHQDMIFSQGTYWPKDVHQKWGFVLCCGFFYIKNKHNTMEFIKELYTRVKKDRDDQISCNRLLLEKNIKWKIDNEYILTFNNIAFKCSEKLITGISKKLTLAVLPHSKFQRIHIENKDAYIKHIISDKDSTSIINILKDTGCLFIKKEK